jgi:hypothetical protein
MRISIRGVSHWHATMHVDAVRSTGVDLLSVWDEDTATAATFLDRHAATAHATLADKPLGLAAAEIAPLAARAVTLHDFLRAMALADRDYTMPGRP